MSHVGAETIDAHRIVKAFGAEEREAGRFREALRHLYRTNMFFFKQKTAYEIGLGIPAEPLFRSLLDLVGLATKSNQIKQLIRNGRSASLQRTFKKSFTKIGRASCRERV